MLLSTSVILLLFITILILTLLMGSLWTRRSETGAAGQTMLLLLASLTWWALMYLLEIIVDDPTLKLLVWRLKFLGVTAMPVTWLLLGLHLSGNSAVLKGSRAWLLWIMPLLTNIVLWTNGTNGMMFENVRLEPLFDGYQIIDNEPMSWFWLHTLYSYGVIAVGTGVMLRFFLRAPKVYRVQLIALIIALIVPLTVNVVIVVTGVVFDATPIAFSVTGVVTMFGVLRFRLLSLTPAARDQVIESMSDALFVLDVQNRIIDLNRAALSLLGGGRTLQQVMGMSLMDAMPQSEQNARMAEHYRSASDTQDEVMLILNGEDRYFDLRISPIQTNPGEAKGRVVLLRDITERIRASERIRAQNEALIATNEQLAEARLQAESANRLKDQFLANMSHELRTPLNAIMGYTEILVFGMVGDLSSEQKHHLERVLANAEQLLALINDVLDIARIEVDQVSIRPQPFAVRPWLEALVEPFRNGAQKRDLSVVLTVDPALPDQIVEDNGRLAQVVTNLLTNALKFTEKGGITVSAARHGNAQWALSVRDTGIGIPQHAHGFIFEPFRQLDGSERRKYGGTGLGLAIARQLTQLMGGEIMLESEPGAGSTFTILLPLHPHLAPAAP